MHRPIMLWMTSRSRSSMVSAIFINHNIWWGDTHAKISGYEMNENQHIKTLHNQYKSAWGRPYMRAITPDPVVLESFLNNLSRIVPSDRKWMMKTGVEYFPAYAKLNPYNIFITRNTEDVAKSLCDKRQDVSYKDAIDAVKWRYEYMEQLQLQHDGVFVDTDKIISGDFSEIKNAIEYCELTYDEKATKKAIIK